MAFGPAGGQRHKRTSTNRNALGALSGLGTTTTTTSVPTQHLSWGPISLHRPFGGRRPQVLLVGVVPKAEGLKPFGGRRPQGRGRPVADAAPGRPRRRQTKRDAQQQHARKETLRPHAVLLGAPQAGMAARAPSCHKKWHTQWTSTRRTHRLVRNTPNARRIWPVTAQHGVRARLRLASASCGERQSGVPRAQHAHARQHIGRAPSADKRREHRLVGVSDLLDAPRNLNTSQRNIMNM